ncbi:hypothetical protein IWX92DRAFT_33126 [Phyllosticta citricarpa]
MMMGGKLVFLALCLAGNLVQFACFSFCSWFGPRMLLQFGLVLCLWDSLGADAVACLSSLLACMSDCLIGARIQDDLLQE